MSIRTSFESESIERSDVFLDSDEEVELQEQLSRLVDLQLNGGEPTEYTAHQAIELAGLAFVAGRAYQSEVSDTEEENTVTVELSKSTIEALLARVVAERLGFA